MSEEYHVHVYRVTDMIEEAIDASDAAQAQAKALAIATERPIWHPSDCSYIAIPFPVMQVAGTSTAAVTGTTPAQALRDVLEMIEEEAIKAKGCIYPEITGAMTPGDVPREKIRVDLDVCYYDALKARLEAVLKETTQWVQ